MKMRSKKAQFAGRCVFCSQYGLSKEHIWPEWMRAFVPRRFQKTVHSVVHRERPSGLVEATTGGLHRPGDPMSQRLRIVCTKCNGGWMSNLQKQAREPLVLLIQGSLDSVGPDEQRRLAAWCAMFS